MVRCYVSIFNRFQSLKKSEELSSEMSGCVCYTPNIFLDHNFIALYARESVVVNYISLSFWQWQLCTLLHCPLRSPAHFTNHAHTQVPSPSSYFSSLTSLFQFSYEMWVWDYITSTADQIILCSPTEFVSQKKASSFSSLQHDWGLNIKCSSKVFTSEINYFIPIYLARLRPLNNFQLNCSCYETLGIIGDKINKQD